MLRDLEEKLIVLPLPGNQERVPLWPSIFVIVAKIIQYSTGLYINQTSWWVQANCNGFRSLLYFAILSRVPAPTFPFVSLHLNFHILYGCATSKEEVIFHQQPSVKDTEKEFSEQSQWLTWTTFQ